MNKTIFCFLAAALMLSFCVSAEATVDETGNAVCEGGRGQFKTTYHPGMLNDVLQEISLEYLVDESTNLIECNDDGSIVLSYRTDFGAAVTIDFAKVYGTVTANPATKKIEISDGELMPLELPERRQDLSPLSIRGKSITLQFVKDAQQKIKPMFKVSKDGIYALETGEEGVFFGCEEKDARGRAASCAMSGQLHKKGDAEAYLTITGSGFVSEDAFGFGGERLSNVYAGPKNIEDIRAVRGTMGVHPDYTQQSEHFTAIRFSDLKEIKVFIAPSMRTDTAYQLRAKAEMETSAIDSVRIKSGKEIDVVNFIDNYNPQDSGTGLVKIIATDNLKLTADSNRLSEGTPFFASLASEGQEALISVFMERNKLAESDHDIYVFPESAGGAYNVLNSGYATALDSMIDSLLLKPGSKEMKIFSAYSALDVTLIPGYDTVTITPVSGIPGGEGRRSVKVTNPRNNMWIMYADNELTWTPGKTIRQLGFNFNVNLNPALGESEMLSCTTDGNCWLGNTMVVAPGGLTQDKLEQAVRPVRREAEEAQKAAGGCDSIEDCPEGRYCDISMDEPECKRIGRMSCSEEEPCVAGLYCDSGRCRDIRGVACENDEECPENYACDAELKRCTMPSGQIGFGVEFGKTVPRQVSGEEFEKMFGEEKGVFRRAWDWVKGLFGAKTAEELPPFAECEIDSECGRNEKCIEGECLVRCSNDMGCAPDFVCREGACRMGCSTDVDCFQGRRCIDKLCARPALPPFSEEP